MKNFNLKRKRSLLNGLVMSFAVMTAAFMLLTSCGSKSAVSSSANGRMQHSDNQLSGDYALLHLYRPKSMVGMAISYNLQLGDEVVFRVKNNSKTTLKVTSAGLKTLWAKTETRTELPVNVKLGQEYYIRCGLGMGAFVGRPKLEQVDSQRGKAEFSKIR